MFRSYALFRLKGAASSAGEEGVSGGGEVGPRSQGEKLPRKRSKQKEEKCSAFGGIKDLRTEVPRKCEVAAWVYICFERTRAQKIFPSRLIVL